MSPRPARRDLPAPLGVVVGPTGVGKSALAMAIARRQPVEIVVADSRQVYRGMDIGTAKPDAGDRAAVPHHLLDLADVDDPFTLADWLANARGVIPQVAARGRLPLVVGGTGLYVTALLDGYELPGPPGSPDVRRRLVEELEAEGLAAMAARLRQVDPSAAARIDSRNPRRVMRALERARAGPGETPGAEPYAGRVAVLGLRRPREVLVARIDARTAQMFDSGLLQETGTLLEAGYGPELGPMTGHGYREAARVLAGEWSLEQAVAVTQRHTRQYAKRQMTWFRRDVRIVWLDAGDAPADDERLVERAVGLLRRQLYA